MHFTQFSLFRMVLLYLLPVLMQSRTQLLINFHFLIVHTHGQEYFWGAGGEEVPVKTSGVPEWKLNIFFSQDSSEQSSSVGLWDKNTEVMAPNPALIQFHRGNRTRLLRGSGINKLNVFWNYNHLQRSSPCRAPWRAHLVRVGASAPLEAIPCAVGLSHLLQILCCINHLAKQSFKTASHCCCFFFFFFFPFFFLFFTSRWSVMGSYLSLEASGGMSVAATQPSPGRRMMCMEPANTSDTYRKSYCCYHPVTK